MRIKLPPFPLRWRRRCLALPPLVVAGAAWASGLGGALQRTMETRVTVATGDLAVLGAVAGVGLWFGFVAYWLLTDEQPPASPGVHR